MMIIREREERDVLLLTSSNGGQLQSKEIHKQDKRERSLLSGMFPQAATNNTFALLLSLSLLSLNARVKIHEKERERSMIFKGGRPQQHYHEYSVNAKKQNINKCNENALPVCRHRN